ncbi:MAG TPA: chemotaxis protein CheW [Methylomirabilota bacterium]|nr:chemotaxis protein CheW [Methylomirabilota bacterium]
MKLKPQTTATRRARRSEQMILFRIAHQLFAISANAVQEVRSADGMTGRIAEVPRAELRKVRHVVQRGERTVYVIDGGIQFGIPAAQSALVFVLRDLRAALLVDAIDRMASFTALHALPEAFCHEERGWYRGLVILDSNVIPVVDPRGLLSRGDLELLDANEHAPAANRREVRASA